MPVLDVPPPSKGATAPLGLGEVLAGKYRVEKLLGAGGMGLVVLATPLEKDGMRGPAVAIKLMRDEALKDAEARARFAREASAVVRLRSEHVARVSDVGTLDDGAPYLVMEYLVGKDLAQVLGDAGKMRPAEAVAYLLQICEGMAEAHGAGIIHRDLKPRNVFVTNDRDGRPLLKILDFGISKLVPVAGETMDMSLTKTTDVMGSPSYMAPEQLRSARDADEQSDVWSLGVMLYEMIAGRLPWEATSLTELGAMVLRDPLTPMRAHCPDVSPELDAVLARCLAKDRRDRFKSVVDLANALEPHAEGLAEGSAVRVLTIARSRISTAGRAFNRTAVSWSEADRDAPQITLPPPAATSPRALWAFAGALLLVAVGATGWLLAARVTLSKAQASPILPEDRGAVRPPQSSEPAAVVASQAPHASPAPSSEASPPATGATLAPPSITTLPRTARTPHVAPPIVSVAPPPPPAAPPSSTSDAHDLGAIPRK